MKTIDVANTYHYTNKHGVHQTIDQAYVIGIVIAKVQGKARFTVHAAEDIYSFKDPETEHIYTIFDDTFPDKVISVALLAEITIIKQPSGNSVIFIKDR